MRYTKLEVHENIEKSCMIFCIHFILTLITAIKDIYVKLSQLKLNS